MTALQNIQLLDLALGIPVETGVNRQQATNEQGFVSFDQILGLFTSEEKSLSQEQVITADSVKELDARAASLSVDFGLQESQQNDVMETTFPNRLIIESKEETEIAPKPGEHVFRLNRVSPASDKIQQVKDDAIHNEVGGSFKVMELQTFGDRAEFVVAPVSHSTKRALEEKIIISLPADILYRHLTKADTEPKEIGLRTESHAQRIPLTSHANQRADNLDELFSKLNLREIEIDDSQSNKDALETKHKEVMKISIVGSDAKATLVSLELPKEEVRFKRVLKPGLRVLSDVSKQQDVAKEISTIHKDPVPAEKTAISDEMSDTVEPEERFNRLFKPGEKVSKEFELLGQSKESTGQLVRPEISGVVKPVFNGKTVFSTVRLTLPDAELPSLRPDGRSVSLRIEPDHLGPARLSLTMNDQMLSARVTVQTVQARTVVEHSLDQLLDQLNRAGVRVESIEVNVAGGNAQGSLPERRSVFRPLSRFINFADSEEEIQPNNSVIDPVGMSGGRYIEGKSLNLLA